MRRCKFPLVALAFIATIIATHNPPTTLAADNATAAATVTANDQHWSTLITPEALHNRLGQPNLLVIDVRAAKDYAAGHIPEAINVPGADWRTPAAKPGSGAVGQQIFRLEDGSVDVARYEHFLGDAGIKPEHEIVVYGNYAGKADGSVPAAILLKLGHKNVAFLDGVGLKEWEKAGYPVSKIPAKIPASAYKAQPDLKRFWTYQDVLKNLDNPNVVIVDSRTPEEFAGTDLRGNKRGGHIPGAHLLNSEDFLDKQSHKTIAPDVARKKVEAVVSDDKDKTVVIYCQSGTRCSLKELMLKDLGYKNVVLYDASFQDWSNRDDAPVETDAAAVPTP